MANIIVLSPRASDAATMAASSQVAALPVANMQDMQPRKVWRSTSTTEHIVIASAAPVAANMLGMNGHNLSDIGVWRVRAADTEANLTAAPLFDTGWHSVWPASGKPTVPDLPNFLSALRWDNNSEFAFWRVDLADPSAGQTFLQIGRLALGRYWQPSINVDADATIGYDQRDPQVTTDYGNTFTDRRRKSAGRLFTLKISAADVREVNDGIAEIQRLRGMWGDAFVLLDPDATTDFHRFSAQAVFSAQQQHQAVQLFTANGPTWTVNLPLREVL